MKCNWVILQVATAQRRISVKIGFTGVVIAMAFVLLQRVYPDMYAAAWLLASFFFFAGTALMVRATQYEARAYDGTYGTQWDERRFLVFQSKRHAAVRTALMRTTRGTTHRY